MAHGVYLQNAFTRILNNKFPIKWWQATMASHLEVSLRRPTLPCA